MNARRLIVVTALLALVGAAASTIAQQKDPKLETGERVRIHRPVEYPFRVDPMVHRLEARRGQTLPVTFQIIGKDKPTTVIVKKVALRQQENGVILPDEDAEPPEFLQIDNEGQYDINPNETVEIRGEVKLPSSSQSNFHTYGLLIKDIGQQLSARGPAGDDESRVGINFVTQYLCRTDIQVQGVRGENLAELRFESAELVESEGLPMARVWVTNPTDSPLEFQTRCQLTNETVHARRPHFSLVMPVRSKLKGDDRHSIRILPGATLRLEDLVPYPLFPGDYELTAEILNRSRPVAEAGFQVAVDHQQFPALAATVAQVTDRVTAVPAQVELSLRSGGSRFSPVTFTNNSTEEVEVDLSPASTGEGSADWLGTRPSRLRLKPGQERKALVVLGANRDIDSHRFAAVIATARTLDGELLGEHTLPVALVGRDESGPILGVSTIEYDPDADHPAFFVKVENTGSLHLPLKGQLQLAAEQGQPMRATGGHGKWLMPGATDRIRFGLPGSPEPGLYELRLRIESADPETPFTFQQVLELK